MSDRAERVREHFSQEAGSYEESSHSGAWDFWRRVERRAILRALRPRRGDRILDAGSGTGYYTGILLEHGAEVIACDFSQEMALVCHHKHGVPAFVADLEEVAIRPVFDAILCAGAMEFCTHPERAFRCLARGLARRPGSRLVVMLPVENFAGRLYRRYHRRHGFEINLFSHSKLHKMARQNRLRVTIIRRVGFNLVARFEPHGIPK